MSTQIQTRRGLAATWTSANPILAIGEMGLETDTRKIKFGDGVTAWTGLAYGAATVDNATVNAAIAEDPAESRTALELGITTLDARYVPDFANGCAVIIEGDSVSSYSANLAPKIARFSPTIYSVAVAGAVLGDVEARYAAQVYPKRPAVNGGRQAWLLLNIGTNDIGGLFNDTVAIAAWLVRLEAYVTQARADGFNILWMTIHRRADGGPGGITFVSSFDVARVGINKFIRSKTNLWHKLVEADFLFPRPFDTFQTDGVHPTSPVGRDRLADAIYRALVMPGRTTVPEAMIPDVKVKFRVDRQPGQTLGATGDMQRLEFNRYASVGSYRNFNYGLPADFNLATSTFLVPRTGTYLMGYYIPVFGLSVGNNVRVAISSRNGEAGEEGDIAYTSADNFAAGSGLMIIKGVELFDAAAGERITLRIQHNKGAADVAIFEGMAWWCVEQ